MNEILIRCVWCLLEFPGDEMILLRDGYYCTDCAPEESEDTEDE